MTLAGLTDGLVVVVRADCATCTLVRPVIAQLEIPVISEDDDMGLEQSYHLGVGTVPTVLRIEGGREVDRIEGWQRGQWEQFTGVAGLGEGLPDYRPGCGSRTLDPDMVDVLAVRFGGSVLRARRVDLADLEDEFEALFDRGWTDGLPVVPRPKRASCACWPARLAPPTTS